MSENRGQHLPEKVLSAKRSRRLLFPTPGQEKKKRNRLHKLYIGWIFNILPALFLTASDANIITSAKVASSPPKANTPDRRICSRRPLPPKAIVSHSRAESSKGLWGVGRHEDSGLAHMTLGNTICIGGRWGRERKWDIYM